MFSQLVLQDNVLNKVEDELRGLMGRQNNSGWMARTVSNTEFLIENPSYVGRDNASAPHELNDP